MQKPGKISWKDTNLALSKSIANAVIGRTNFTIMRSPSVERTVGLFSSMRPLTVHLAFYFQKVGSEIDHKVKAAAAANEAAWDGIGQKEEIRVWRIENFQVKAWPQDQYGQFFRGDSYIVLKTYKEKSSDAFKHDIHIWIGSESTADEYGTAAYKMVEADEYLGGTPVQYRQVEGKESLDFAQYFQTLEYLDGGVASGFNKVEPTIDNPLFFCVKGTQAKTLKLMQVPRSIKSMNEGDSFILFASKEKVWCWHGKEVSMSWVHLF
jgi:gelsolin